MAAAALTNVKLCRRGASELVMIVGENAWVRGRGRRLSWAVGTGG